MLTIELYNIYNTEHRKKKHKKIIIATQTIFDGIQSPYVLSANQNIMYFIRPSIHWIPRIH